MALKDNVQAVLSRVGNQEWFFQRLLGETLEWPVGAAQDVDDLAFSWSAEDLRAADLERKVVEGGIWQIQPLAHGQPWGMFVLEFKNPEALVARRGMAGVLRTVLRGLVASRRKAAGLPSWKREHLLFICTHGWEHFRFAYFRSKPEDPQASRLATFGWGPGISNRTVCEFNLPPLLWPEDPSNGEAWVSAWAKAFDKEPLTRDFFKRFDDALEAIKSDLEHYQKLTSAEAYSQAQLLLERLIFLYFLQNRGWLNQDGRYLPDKLKEYITKPEAFSYYTEFLDKLFWTLASAPGSGARLPGIPFLNGGLFDDDEFRQPAETRKANPPLKVRNATFRHVFSELLEAFNFTVTEDTPLNQEVAVDPEMLGKVFESIILHAEAADPDAIAPDKRKATGSYYTPRIVVHFICREVLYQYLLAHLPSDAPQDGWTPRLKTLLALDASDGINDEKRDQLRQTLTPSQAIHVLELVKPLRCCDPAVGSGAFPVGLMHELVNLRRLLETVANGYVDPVRRDGAQWLHDTKADLVQNCLFGVDIQQQAIEICRLRLWLSLVVDYDLGLDPFTAERSQFSRAIERISQLPNLEMNFHRGDSLHDHISGVPVVILPNRASRYSEEFKAIGRLGEKLHQAKRAETKKKLRVEILEKRLELSGRILEDEIAALRTNDSALDTLFGLSESAAEKRKRNQQELGRLEEAQKKVARDRDELDRLRTRVYDSQFYPKLRKLEGADFDSPFNFAWRLDFPGIFTGNGTGFDIIVGNPPFVTARNPVKRELWRQRWPRVCEGLYHMLCPFTELGFELLKVGGELGFIVSNAFAKRDFGRPFVEDFLTTMNIQKIVDCSGLLFPGHGTPTCLLFGSNQKLASCYAVRVVATMPGGGDLRTAPEESVLWHSIAEHHADDDKDGKPWLSNAAPARTFHQLYEDFHIAVADCSSRKLLQHPSNFAFFDWPVLGQIEEAAPAALADFIEDEVGFCTKTNADDVFLVSADHARRHSLPASRLFPYHQGEEVRNWWAEITTLILLTYDERCQILNEKKLGAEVLAYLRPFKKTLEERRSFGNKTFKQLGWSWCAYDRMNANKYSTNLFLTFPFIATHNHYVFVNERRVFGRHPQVIKLPTPSGAQVHHAIAALCNSSGVLFWLKQVCFNKGAGEDEERDRFEFAGGKVQQLPVPQAIADGLKGQSNALADKLTELSQACWERGQQMPSLAQKKLFEKPGEAYHEWNSSLPGYIPPNRELGPAFESADSLRAGFRKAQEVRECLRTEMIALQEEMDWLVYAAYGLLPENHPAVCSEAALECGSAATAFSSASLRSGTGGAQLAGSKAGAGAPAVQGADAPPPLDREERPFRLWAQAEGDYAKALSLVPGDWPEWRQKLWRARLAAIRDNEHIRRIEQPVYKRRWDEQWKVKNQWRCGAVAYAAEFTDAFEWWLREKAEWWLEHKKAGGPVDLEEWAGALWKDARVPAAWEVAVENYALLQSEKEREKSEQQIQPLLPIASKSDFPSFRKRFKEIIDEETVPEGIPWAVPYDDLEKKKVRVPAKVRNVRGKLNVPRERFHLRNKTQYLWAGLKLRE